MRSVRVRALLMAVAAVSWLAPAGARQLGSRPAAEWIKTLESPERIAGLKVDEVISKLQLKPGTVVADLGAGPGVFALPLARAVGPTGTVYAVEIDQAFLDHIAARLKEQNVSNVRTVLGTPGDPALPAKDVDLALLHDVLHHVEDRTGYLAQVVRYVKPGGRIAVVEYDGAKGPHRDDPRLQVSKQETNGWMADAGFVPAEEFHLFDEKWYVIYKRK